MNQSKKCAFSEWIDTRKYRKEIEETLHRLECAKDGHDIAYNVVANMFGVEGINSKTVLTELFIQTLIDLAPKLKHIFKVHSVRYHIRKMIRDLEWQQKENRQNNEKENNSNAENYVFVVKKIRDGQKAKIENFLTDDNVDYELIKLSDFDGGANSDEIAIQIEGEKGELLDVLMMIEAEFGIDVLDDISLSSDLNRFGRDSLTMAQAINYLKDE